MRGIGRLKGWGRYILTRPLARSMILLYHRVVSLPDDPQKLCVSPENFNEHLAIIRRNFHPLSLSKLNSEVQNGQVTNHGVVITFDDGYADNLLHAKPILEKHNFPATVFAVSDFIGAQLEFFWDDLERVLLTTPKLPDRLEVEIAGKKLYWDLMESAETQPVQTGPTSALMWDVEMPGTPTPRHRVYRELSHMLRDADAEVRERVFKELCAWAGIGRKGRNEHRPLTQDELRALNAGGLIEIGAHTQKHSRLSHLSRAAQKSEIFGSKKKLEALLGQSVTSFSYPFGGLADYNGTSVELAKEAGFNCACANFPGSVHRWSDPFQLPRFLVRNWDGAEFERQLESFFKF